MIDPSAVSGTIFVWRHLSSTNLFTLLAFNNSLLRIPRAKVLCVAHQVLCGITCYIITYSDLSKTLTYKVRLTYTRTRNNKHSNQPNTAKCRHIQKHICRRTRYNIVVQIWTQWTLVFEARKIIANGKTSMKRFAIIFQLFIVEIKELLRTKYSSYFLKASNISFMIILERII